MSCREDHHSATRQISIGRTKVTLMTKPRRRIPRYKKVASKRASGAGRWDPRFGTKEVYDALMARMPEGAIPADLTRHADPTSSNPLLWYVEYEFTCVDCGSDEVWTAEQQKWWYEEAKGPSQSRAIRCRACRKVLRANHGGTPRRPQCTRHPNAAQPGPNEGVEDDR
jgi:Probable zinc-ribbon domain